LLTLSIYLLETAKDMSIIKIIMIEPSTKKSPALICLADNISIIKGLWDSMVMKRRMMKMLTINVIILN